MTDGVSPPDPTRPDVPAEQEPIVARKRARQLPDDFEVDADLKAWAVEKCPKIDTERETEQWRDYHRAKGDTAKDWRASWRTWMRNAQQWNRTPSKPQNGAQRGTGPRSAEVVQL